MRRSILIVDDDDLFRRLAVRVLRSWGHAVAGEAATMQEALNRARELRPDIVLADIGLPDGDGFSLTKALCSGTPAPDVVLFSSDSDAGNAAMAGRAGARAFFPKDDLTGAELRRLLERS